MSVYIAYIVLAVTTIAMLVLQNCKKARRNRTLCLFVAFSWIISVILCFVTINWRGDFKPVEYWFASLFLSILLPKEDNEKGRKINLIAFVLYAVGFIVAWAMIVPPLP